MTFDSQLGDFAEEARRFCNWAMGKDGSAISGPMALRRVSALYTAALELPPPFTEGLEEDISDVELPTGDIDLVAKRVATLPLQLYWEIFDPIQSPPEEPVAGWIADDLHDIYLDVARGLVLFDSGDRAEALWEWKFNFVFHWGEHATSAIRAFHAYFSQTGDDDALSRDV